MAKHAIKPNARVHRKKQTSKSTNNHVKFENQNSKNKIKEIKTKTTIQERIGKQKDNVSIHFLWEKIHHINTKHKKKFQQKKPAQTTNSKTKNPEKKK